MITSLANMRTVLVIAGSCAPLPPSVSLAPLKSLNAVFISGVNNGAEGVGVKIRSVRLLRHVEGNERPIFRFPQFYEIINLALPRVKFAAPSVSCIQLHNFS